MQPEISFGVNLAIQPDEEIIVIVASGLRDVVAIDADCPEVLRHDTEVIAQLSCPKSSALDSQAVDLR